jgi:lipopolysaccharide transport protein LptA
VKYVLVAAICLSLVSPLWAQDQDNAPVDIKSDRLTIHQKEQRAVFEGNVKTVQGELRIDCEKLTVTYAGEKDKTSKAGEIKQMVFTGSVSITQKKRSGHCEKAVYDRVAGRIVCTGDPWVVEGENRIRGERIVYLLEEDQVRVNRPQAVIRLPDDRAEGPKKKGGKNK